MRILILGGDGMLGHRLLRHLMHRHDVRVTLRHQIAAYAHHELFSEANSFDCIDLQMPEVLMDVMTAFSPNAVINVAGIVKQRKEASEAIASIQINALLPHRLARLCALIGARLICLSTDCVFSGKKGNHSEFDVPDPEDLYGRTKLLGEVDAPGCLTIRTSVIGSELARKTSLVEWFLARSGEVPGYRKAIFSGFTACELSRVIERILLDHSTLSGIWHVSSTPIRKFDLLEQLGRDLQLGSRIIVDDSVCCDRSLDSSRFKSITGYSPPSWQAMIAELAAEIRKERRL